MSEMILPTNSTLYTTFQQLATQQRMIFLAGLPGTGPGTGQYDVSDQH